MKLKIFIAMVITLVVVTGIVSGGTIPITPSNTSAQQLGGLYNSYVFPNGDDHFEVFTAIPLTTQGDVVPTAWFYMLFVVSIAFLGAGILLTAKSDSVPSMAITACGILAFGGFISCAMMAPLVADTRIDQQILQNVDKSGVPIGNNSVYVTQTVDYQASPWMAYLCWGLGIAGFVEMVLGALSFVGWFQKRGMRKARSGTYLETEDGDDR